MENTVSILLLQFRDDAAEAETEKRSFLRATGLVAGQMKVCDALSRPVGLSALDGVSAVLIGGSAHSVFETVPNLDAAVALVREARSRRLPVFGCCFGAQLLARAFGGEVVRDQTNEEFGTFAVRVSDDSWTDPLFIDQPDEFPVQCAHHDRIARLPAGAVCLASNELCPVQAFVIPGTGLYGTQFHPERSRGDYETLIARRMITHPDKTEKLDMARRTLVDTHDAERLLNKFMDRIVRGRQKSCK